MRAADLASLSERYPDGGDAGTRGPTRILGVETPIWDDLGERIFADFVTDPPYGIGWWAPHPGTSRRIFISDQFDACTSSVTTNMVEAALHWMELDAIDREDAFQADVIQMVNGEPRMVARPRMTPLESLGPDIVRLHQVGVARALSGALDCAAGTIIGVMALPMNILKADFQGVIRHFERRAAPMTEAETRQNEFGQQLTRIVEQTGPAGWLDWLLNFRNMLVHRGRRIEIGQFVPRLPFLRDPNGRPIIRANVITQLPQEPDTSDVDVHLGPNIPPVLTEDVRQTLAGAMGSVRTLIEALAEQLIAAWDWRKANPDVLQQPRAQWPRIGEEARAGRRQPFVGYAPGTHQYEPGQLMSHPRTMRNLERFAVAARRSNGTRTLVRRERLGLGGRDPRLEERGARRACRGIDPRATCRGAHRIPAGETRPVDDSRGGNGPQLRDRHAAVECAMAKTSSRTKKRPAEKLDAPEKLKIDLTRFKPDLTANDLKNALTPVRFSDVNIFTFPTIETISPMKTIGLGRTNLTLVRPVILQTDASPAFASFEAALGTPQQRPTVSVHFEPSVYGLTGNVTFVMGFSLEAFGTVNLDLGAFAGSGTVTGLGPRSINGRQIVSMVFNNVPATQQVFGLVAQTGGATVRWFQTRISYLPVIVQA